jgi:hypothetical protein
MPKSTMPPAGVPAEGVAGVRDAVPHRYHQHHARGIDTHRSCDKEDQGMTQTTTCEHCGTVVPLAKAERLVVEDCTHYFCSERCKIQWGEMGEIEEDE